MPIDSVATLLLEKLKPQLQESMNRQHLDSKTFWNILKQIYEKKHSWSQVASSHNCSRLVHVLFLFSCPSVALQQLPLSVSFPEFLCVFVKLQALETLQMRRSCKIPSKGCLRCWRHMAPRRTSQWRSYCGIGRIRTATRSVFLLSCCLGAI